MLGSHKYLCCEIIIASSETYLVVVNEVLQNIKETNALSFLQRDRIV